MVIAAKTRFTFWLICLSGWHVPGAVLAAGQKPAATPESPQTLERFAFQRICMGSPFQVLLYGDTQAAASKAAKAAFDRVDKLNDLMSDYDDQSELMRLCRNAKPGKPTKISPELFFVLQRSTQLSRQTSGAFDITVGPYVRLWRTARRTRVLPDQQTLAEVDARVGYQHLQLDAKQQTAILAKPDMQLDLGAIAKGYAADEALAILRKKGFPSALIDAGGDIVLGEPPPGKPGWRIEIEPLDRQTSKQENEARPNLLTLSNCAIATSGDLYQFVEIGGKRYAHIVDPRTGLGMTARRSVTVIAKDGITADSLASALFVLGPEKGVVLINQTENTEGLVVELLNGKRRTAASKNYPGAKKKLDDGCRRGQPQAKK